MTELLAPAGDEKTAYAALRAGADAVYLGLTRFSARESAENFCVSSLAKLTREAHLLGAKVYVALNTLVKDDELSDFFCAAREAWNAGADAILLQDIFLGRALRELYPEIVTHLSTQAGCCNVHGARLAKACGFSRVVLARETPIGDIPAISEIIETEAFVQGALCTCFSGQCYLSSFAGNNSGNRGRCKQPCRKRYSIDRAGYEDRAYAISLSDLSVGADAEKLLSAGVTSLKVEGRMRSAAYVAAAVEYYRALLDKRPADELFSRLKRTFNRGNYTRGLAFGQDANLLSRSVQGHIGERAGTLSRREGKWFCASSFAAEKGDAFKILRGGKEVGGALFAAAGKGGFYLSSRDGLAAGDEVRITLDVSLTEHALSLQKKRPVRVRVTLRAGEEMRAEGEGFSLTGAICECAKNAPLSAQEVCACFAKTDALPFAPCAEVETDGVFVPKSVLNAFRRDFYEGLAAHLAPARVPLPERQPSLPGLAVHRGGMTAAIVTGHAMPAGADMVIWKPADYADMDPPKGTWLYLPPFFTAADEALVAPRLHLFEGICCDGTYGAEFAKKYGVKLFAGTGWNLTNRIAVAGALGCCTYAALSKELTLREQDALAADGTFVLSAGGIKVMDLCYCPFGRACAECDRREMYTMTDEEGRAFPLRRYRAAGGCRFELYNCAPLAAGAGSPSALVDCTVGGDGIVAYARDPAGKLPGATRGHAARSLL